MYLLQRLFPPAPLLPEHCHIEIQRVSPEDTSEVRWYKRLVNYPFVAIQKIYEIYKKIYNTYLLMRHMELLVPLSANVCPLQNGVDSFSTVLFKKKVGSRGDFIKKLLLESPRKSKEGIFYDKQNAEVFMPILRDVDKDITEDDFLLTCDEKYVKLYRKPLEFIGAKNLNNHQEELENVVEETVQYWKKKSDEEGKINVTELSHVFSTNVISKLLLGHPGPFEEYCKIAGAIDYINKYIVRRTWKAWISSEDEKRYKRSVEIVKEAINVVLDSKENPPLGSLIESMKKEGMNERQIKANLWLLYFAGTETTASLLTYLLWQLGQTGEDQDEIVNEIKNFENSSIYHLATKLQSVEKVFKKAIGQFVPTYVISRDPADDLMCTIKDKQGHVVRKDFISKKDGILAALIFGKIPFGYGVHRCPGEMLARIEVKCIVIRLLMKGLKIHSSPKKITPKGYMILKIAETVEITLKNSFESAH